MNKIITNLAILSLIFGVFLALAGSTSAQTALTAVMNAPTVGQDLTVNQAFNFAGSASGGNAPYAFVWNFGDGSGASGANFNKTYTTTGAKTVVLTVTDFSGAQASVTRTVNVVSGTSPTAPTVDLLVNGGNGPVTIATGTPATLSWTSTNATSCTASGTWSGDKAVNSSETITTSATEGTFVYTLTCTGTGGTNSDNVTINTGTASGPTLVITNIQVTNVTQTGATITWDTNLPADSRVIYDTVSHPTLGSAPDFGYAFTTPTSDSNPKVTSHSVVITGLTANTQYFFRVLSQS